jgi:hypothetical protein
MKQIAAQSKENFFEHRATNYQITGVNDLMATDKIEDCKW